MRRPIFPVAAAALLVVALGAPGVSAATGDPVLVISQSTTLSADHDGVIIIDTSGVTLDCAGHTVRGAGVQDWSGGINVFSVDGVTVKHCVVSGFAERNGLYADGATNLRLEDDTFVRNGASGVHLNRTTSATITSSQARDNAGYGFVISDSSGAVISGCAVSANHAPGIGLLGARDSTVTGNKSNRNGAGVVLDDWFGSPSLDNSVSDNVLNSNTFGAVVNRYAAGNSFSRNTANGNSNGGFQVVGSASGNTFVDNVANSNRRGFDMSDTHHNLVTGNVANANTEYGFVVYAGSSFNTLRDNTGLGNGIYDAAGNWNAPDNTWTGNHFRTTDGFTQN